MRFWKKNKIFLLSFLLTLVCGGFLLAGFAYAQTDIYGLNPVSNNIGLGSDDIRLTIAKIIRAVLGLLGIIAIGIMLYGGFIYMTAGGNEERIGTAKKILINGVIGLVIILSSFSIAQFLINKLSQATFIPPGGGDLCDDDVYALSHKDECFPELPNLCKGDNQPDWCCIADLEKSDVFIVKSITPVTDDTGINNVMIRAIFNRSVANDFSPDQVFDIKYDGQSVKGDFDFQFYADKQFVQATYKGEGTCFDEDKGEEVPCINFGDYDVVVNGDLTSKEGYKITEETDCGVFPLEAKFSVGDDSDVMEKKALSFDGIDDYIKLGINPLSGNSFSIEFWMQPKNLKESYLFEGAWRKYSISLLDDGGFRFRLVENKDAQGNDVWNTCDAEISAGSLKPNEWYHVVAVFDSSLLEKRQKVYINGELLAETLHGKDFEGCKDFQGTNDPLSIGSGLIGNESNEVNNPFKGYLASACIYNNVLPFGEIQDHFGQGVGSCGQKDSQGLLASWNFKGDGNVIEDISENNFDGQIVGASWKNIYINLGEKIIDKIKPIISSWDIQGPKTDEGDLKPNKVYNLTADITDNSGLGFYNFKMNKKTYNAGGVVQEENIDLVDYLDGPRVSRGSDIPLANPFNFSYPVFTSKNPQKLINYTLTLSAFDIDSQRGEASYSYTLKPEHCINGVQDADETGIDSGGSCGGGPGDACLEDWQCSDGKCIDKKCVTYPKIIDVSPAMSGAEGNWLSILGKNFGEDEGKVEFAFDKNDDGEIDDDEWGEAIEANIVDKAGCGDTWTDKIIVVEVPSDLLIAVNSETSIRVVRADNSVLWDSTTDDYG
ncbi:hypothetical protein KJ785_02200, partial [Patescibacteria group bacterium]|nr:hypothetical protein [Patescibacteria group bacterium]